VDTFPFVKGKWSDKEAALCELLEMNNTIWNQIVVEDQDLTNNMDLVTDPMDTKMKEQAVIGATVPDREFDDGLNDWAFALNTTDVINNDVSLSPQLNQQDDLTELSECFFDQFVNINTLGSDAQQATTFDSNTMMDDFDMNAFLQSESGGLEDEVTAAVKLLTEEDERFADEMISHLENDITASSPETYHKPIADDFLSELLREDNAEKPFDVETAPSPSDLDTLTQLLSPETPCMDEKVLNEFANLLNAFDASLRSNAEESGLCDINIDSTITNSAHSAGTFNVQICEETIDSSVHSPTNSVCTVTDIPKTIVIRKRKRKFSEKDEDHELNTKIFRRIRNNEASKVTRAKRKSRHSELFERERKLTDSNIELRAKLEVMQKEADILRQLLVATLSNSNDNKNN